jgi:hypothetical protein
MKKEPKIKAIAKPPRRNLFTILKTVSSMKYLSNISKWDKSLSKRRKIISNQQFCAKCKLNIG